MAIRFGQKRLHQRINRRNTIAHLVNISEQVELTTAKGSGRCYKWSWMCHRIFLLLVKVICYCYDARKEQFYATPIVTKQSYCGRLDLTWQNFSITWVTGSIGWRLIL